MREARIVVAALVIFAAGVLTGGVGAGLAGRFLRGQSSFTSTSAPTEKRVSPAAGSRPNAPSNAPSGTLSRPPGRAQIEAMARWTRELDLETSQRQRIDAILDRAGVHLQELWEPVAPQARGEIEGARRQIEQILTPEQRLRWNEVRRRRAVPKPQSAP